MTPVQAERFPLGEKGEISFEVRQQRMKLEK